MSLPLPFPRTTSQISHKEIALPFCNPNAHQNLPQKFPSKLPFEKSEKGSATPSHLAQSRSARPSLTSATKRRSTGKTVHELAWITSILFSAASAALTVQAADWPQWRGPDGTGVSTEKNLPIIWH